MVTTGFILPVQAESSRYAAIPPFALLATIPRQHAVLMQPDRQLITLASADQFGESGAYIVEILTDRIVLQQTALDDSDPSRLIWLYLAESPERSSRMVTLDRIPPLSPLTMQPAAITLTASPAAGRQY